MAKVNSTAIRSVTYRVRRGVEVTFHNGGTYVYNAPRSVARLLQRSRSVGVDYNRHLKPLYTATKVR